MTILEELCDICSACNGDIPKDSLVEGKCIWDWDKEARDAERRNQVP